MRVVVIGASILGLVLINDRPAAAICREVVQRDSPPPLMEPQQPVLLVLRRNVEVGQTCLPPAAGSDAGVDGDAGASPPADAGADAGAATADAATTDASLLDAGVPDAGAGLDCQPRYGDAVTMVVQPRFTFHDGGARFALLLVTPRPPVVQAAAPDVFLRLAEATYPRVVTQTEYVEDSSLGYQCNDPKWDSGGGGGGGCAPTGGGGGSGWDPDDYDNPSGSDAAPPGGGAIVQTIGAYEVAVLAVTDVPTFTAWLDANDYDWDAADVNALAPYLAMGWTVIAVKISGDQALLHGGLEPLAFTWEGSELRVPVGVSRFPQGGQTLLSIFVAADGRYDIPDASVTFAERTGTGGAAFLTRNEYFADLSLPADADPIAESIPGSPEYRDTVTVTEEVHIPSSECPNPPSRGGCGSDDRDSDESLCGCRTGVRGRTQLGNWLIVLAAGVVLARATRKRLLRTWRISKPRR